MNSNSPLKTKVPPSEVNGGDLQQVLNDYQSRTAGSKAIAERYRAHHVDKSSIRGKTNTALATLDYPIVIGGAQGAYLRDIDGNQYIDILQGLGTHLFGHNPEFVRIVLEEQLQKGVPVGGQSELVGRVAELITELTGMPRVCFSNTGTEAIMTAIRVARAKTARSKIAVFTNSYHGHSDTVLMRAPVVEYARKKMVSRLSERPWLAPVHKLLERSMSHRAVAASCGIPPAIARDVIVLEYGSPRSLEIINKQSRQLAAVLVEPVQSRAPELQPREFLHELRGLTQQKRIALIFDEMVTGFRLHPGGAQSYFGIRADIATYSKVVGGGLPLAVVAGQNEYMDCLAPDGSSQSVFFAGTFCKHPMAIAASHAVLAKLKSVGPTLQENLNARTAKLVERLNTSATQQQLPIRFTCFGSFFSIAMTQTQLAPSTIDFLSYYLLSQGIHLRGGDRGGFLSTAHTDDDIEKIATTMIRGLHWLRTIQH